MARMRLHWARGGSSRVRFVAGAPQWSTVTRKWTCPPSTVRPTSPGAAPTGTGTPLTLGRHSVAPDIEGEDVVAGHRRGVGDGDELPGAGQAAQHPHVAVGAQLHEVEVVGGLEAVDEAGGDGRPHGQQLGGEVRRGRLQHGQRDDVGLALQHLAALLPRPPDLAPGLLVAGQPGPVLGRQRRRHRPEHGRPGLGRALAAVQAREQVAVGRRAGVDEEAHQAPAVRPVPAGTVGDQAGQVAAVGVEVGQGGGRVVLQADGRHRAGDQVRAVPVVHPEVLGQALDVPAAGRAAVAVDQVVELVRGLVQCQLAHEVLGRLDEQVERAASGASSSRRRRGRSRHRRRGRPSWRPGSRTPRRAAAPPAPGRRRRSGRRAAPQASGRHPLGRRPPRAGRSVPWRCPARPGGCRWASAWRWPSVAPWPMGPVRSASRWAVAP